jgi:hypothetical protein
LSDFPLAKQVSANGVLLASKSGVAAPVTVSTGRMVDVQWSVLAQAEAPVLMAVKRITVGSLVTPDGRLSLGVAQTIILY